MQQDSFFMRWFGKIGDLCGLSLVWLLCCLPVLTIFPSCIALYDSIAHCIHGGEEGHYRRFFRTFKAELLRGICLELMWLVIGFLLIYGYNITAIAAEGTLAAVYSMLYAGTMLIPISMIAWSIPIQSRFYYKFTELQSTALSMSIAHLPTTAAILGIQLASIIIVFLIPPMLALMPGICVTLQSWLIEKIFKRYIEEEALDTTE